VLTPCVIRWERKFVCNGELYMSLTSCLPILTFPSVGIVQNGGMRVGPRQVKTVRAVFLTIEFKSCIRLISLSVKMGR
jgi:hypothetical protein